MIGSILCPIWALKFHICRQALPLGQFRANPACDIRAHWISLEEVSAPSVTVNFPQFGVREI